MLVKQQNFVFLLGLSVSKEDKLYLIFKPTFLLQLAMALEAYSKKKGLIKILIKT